MNKNTFIFVSLAAGGLLSYSLIKAHKKRFSKSKNRRNHLDNIVSNSSEDSGTYC